MAEPVESAAVIFHTVHNGKDQGNLEVKTNEEGQAVIDVIPIGDLVRLQVIKSGFQTYGEDYSIEGASKEIAVKLKPPTRGGGGGGGAVLDIRESPREQPGVGPGAGASPSLAGGGFAGGCQSGCCRATVRSYR